jgi:hypothetical protein
MQKPAVVPVHPGGGHAASPAHCRSARGMRGHQHVIPVIGHLIDGQFRQVGEQHLQAAGIACHDMLHTGHNEPHGRSGDDQVLGRTRSSRSGRAHARSVTRLPPFPDEAVATVSNDTTQKSPDPGKWQEIFAVAWPGSSRLQRIGEPLYKITESFVAERPHGRLLALPGKRRLGGRVGALQGAVDRGRGGVQRCGHFPGRKAEHVAEDEDRALPRGQMLQRGDEGQLDRLALFVARLGRGIPARKPELPVGVGLDPHRLGQRPCRRIAAWASRGPVVGREPAPGPAGDRMQAGVGCDLVQPRAERPAAIEPAQPASGAQQGVLERVVGVVHRAEHPVAMRVQFGPIGLDQPAKA